jgi:hypothetical protein
MGRMSHKPIWKLLWKCKIPPKVRIFAWKALLGGLAREANKRRRHIPVSGACQICEHEQEDVFHVLLKCPHAAGLCQLACGLALVTESS